MFVLDTNVLSATISPIPEPKVATWIAARPAADLFTTTVCQAELLAGLAVMPRGRRHAALDAAARALFEIDFLGRLLPFDTAAAVLYAELFAARRRVGRPVGPPDLMIAATAQVHGATVVTRNTSDFEGCGLTLINP